MDRPSRLYCPQFADTQQHEAGMRRALVTAGARINARFLTDGERIYFVGPVRSELEELRAAYLAP